MNKILKSQDKKINKLTKILIEAIDRDFVFEGHELRKEDVFGHHGALSLFLIEAQEVYEKVSNGLYTTKDLLEAVLPEGEVVKMKDADLKKEIDALKKKELEHNFPIGYFEQEEDSFFSFIPRLSEDIPCDFHLLAHYVHFVTEEYVKRYEISNKLENGRVPLEELYAKMSQKINDREIVVFTRPYKAPALYNTVKNQ